MEEGATISCKTMKGVVEEPLILDINHSKISGGGNGSCGRSTDVILAADTSGKSEWTAINDGIGGNEHSSYAHPTISTSSSIYSSTHLVQPSQVANCRRTGQSRRDGPSMAMSNFHSSLRSCKATKDTARPVFRRSSTPGLLKNSF